MNDVNDKRRLQNALNTTLSGLGGDPWLSRKVLANAKGEEKVKKKLSVGLVLVIVLILAAVTALAVGLLWEHQVVPMKQLEQTEGDYINWSVAQREALIQALVDCGSIEESDDTARLFEASTDEATKGAIADKLVLKLTGQTDVKEISVDIITYAVMGSTDTWTPEQRIWWQQVTEQFHGDGGAPDTLVKPDGREPTEAEAIAIARAEILKAYGMPPETLDKALPVANLYVTDQRPDYRRWDVQFKLFKEGTDNWLERVYCAIVDENGEIIADPDVSMPSVEEMAADYRARQAVQESPIVKCYSKYADEANSGAFQSWPVALKAAYSQEMRPMVQLALSNGELKAYDADGVGPTEKTIIASTTYAYGLPSEGDVTEAQALSMARQKAIEEFGDKDIASVYTYYDITAPDTPRWKFVFYPRDWTDTMYRTELDARTGEVLTSEEFERHSLLDSLEYDLKWY